MLQDDFTWYIPPPMTIFEVLISFVALPISCHVLFKKALPWKSVTVDSPKKVFLFPTTVSIWFDIEFQR